MIGMLPSDPCPACGHALQRHPYDEATGYICSRSVEDMPSCVECRTPFEQLLTRRIMPSWLPPEVWEAATDPSLPPGVIVLEGADGARHRYPLIEFGDL